MDDELSWYFGSAHHECEMAHALEWMPSHEIPDGPRADRMLRGLRASRARARGIRAKLCAMPSGYACVLAHAYEPRRFDAATRAAMGEHPAVTAQLESTRKLFAIAWPCGDHPGKRGVYGYCASLPANDSLVAAARHVAKCLVSDARAAYQAVQL